MHTCCVETELLIDTLETRLNSVPKQPNESAYRAAGWGEPGRYEGVLRLPKVNLEYRGTRVPILTFNHRSSLGGRRAMSDTDTYCEELAPWGSARELWRRFCG